jgi:lipoprotein-anchoring transpeptidase ErfK/SrfK
MPARIRRLPAIAIFVAFCVGLLTENTYAQRMLRAGPEAKPSPPAVKKQAPAKQPPAKPVRNEPVAKQPAGTVAAPDKPNNAGGLVDTVALQAALDRAGFSPGVIDGKAGRKTKTAIRAFQAHAGLPATGEPDAATLAALAPDAQPALRQYVVTADDAAQIGPNPRGWVDKSKLPHLGYTSLEALVAERGHCTRALLARLNPGMNPITIKPGDALQIPNIETSAAIPRAERIEVDFGAKTVRAYDKAGQEAALFHCSIAKERAKRPSSNCTVRTVTRNPEYLFDPKRWPEVKDVKQKLLIPAGPRNPVGLCWIGLSLKGYGIHGTPEPEMIGKTGSHGCFRLTNWDALRLAKMVQPGTPVQFVDSTARIAASR